MIVLIFPFLELDLGTDLCSKIAPLGIKTLKYARSARKYVRCHMSITPTYRDPERSLNAESLVDASVAHAVSHEMRHVVTQQILLAPAKNID